MCLRSYMYCVELNCGRYLGILLKLVLRHFLLRASIVF